MTSSRRGTRAVTAATRWLEGILAVEIPWEFMTGSMATVPVVATTTVRPTPP